MALSNALPSLTPARLSVDQPRPAESLRLEPMTVGMILDASFTLYTRHFWTFLALGALYQVPHLLLTAGWSLALMLGMSPALLPGVYALGYLFWWLVLAPWTTGAASVASGEAFLGRDPDLRSALGSATRRIGSLSFTYFMVSLIVAIGFLLLLVPGVFFWLTFFLVLPIVVLEGQDSSGARQRSAFLTAGHRGRILGMMVILILLNTTAQLGVVGLVSLVLDPLQAFTGLAGLAAQWTVAMVTLPLTFVATVVLYYDLRIRKEAFDLETLSAAMGNAGVEPA